MKSEINDIGHQSCVAQQKLSWKELKTNDE